MSDKDQYLWGQRPPSREPLPLRDRLIRILVAVLAVTAVVLASLVWRAAAGADVERAAVGEQVAIRPGLYGQEHRILMPGTSVAVTVSEPTETFANDLVDHDFDDPRWAGDPDLAAPEGGDLVPVTWQVSNTTGVFDVSDLPPVVVRLVVGDQRVDLGSVDTYGPNRDGDANEPRSVAVGVDHDVSLDDLAVEVEFDDMTQTLDVASGDIDAGVAQVLYDGPSDLDTGCSAVGSCALAAPAASPLRPDRASFTADTVSLYPYDAALGWAAEGTVWADVRLQLFTVGNVQNAAGRIRRVAGGTDVQVLLDGAEPVRREGLTGRRYADSQGRAVFAVDAGTVPDELAVTEVLRLQGTTAPRTLALQATLDLVPLG